MLLSGKPIEELDESALREAALRVAALAPEESRALQMRTLVLGTALDWMRAGHSSATELEQILGVPFTERGLRKGTEAGLRALARNAPPSALTGTRWWIWPTPSGPRACCNAQAPISSTAAQAIANSSLVGTTST